MEAVKFSASIWWDNGGYTDITAYNVEDLINEIVDRVNSSDEEEKDASIVVGRPEKERRDNA